MDNFMFPQLTLVKVFFDNLLQDCADSFIYIESQRFDSL